MAKPSCFFDKPDSSHENCVLSQALACSTPWSVADFENAKRSVIIEFLKRLSFFRFTRDFQASLKIL